tara:strand:- start:4912 stop:5292 length:381 start_codon:yes stop_codon:yes gene_type:complete
MDDKQKQKIESSLQFPKILKDQKELKIVEFFSRRPGGNFVLSLIMLLNERNIDCTEDTLFYYIPQNICSKSTLSNIVRDGIQENILFKEPCREDHRSKNITPTQEAVNQWNLWRNLIQKDSLKLNK